MARVLQIIGEGRPLNLNQPWSGGAALGEMKPRTTFGTQSEPRAFRRSNIWSLIFSLSNVVSRRAETCEKSTN